MLSDEHDKESINTEFPREAYPEDYSPESLVAGRCHNGRGDQDENCLNDEDRSIVERFDTDSARDITHELHWE